MPWLIDFAEASAKTDQLRSEKDHLFLLAAGLMGEAGSILSELKKQRRDSQLLSSSQEILREEFGDFLWYYVRLVSRLSPDLLPQLEQLADSSDRVEKSILPLSIEFANAVGTVMESVRYGVSDDSLSATPNHDLVRLWSRLKALARGVEVSLHEAAQKNIRKTTSRWPIERKYLPLFDEDFSEDQQLPRQIGVEFREVSCDGRLTVVLRCNGLNCGDRISDNIQTADGYRFHDVFHLAYAVHLGWSPITRALFRCKRKSITRIDEGEDGARAGVIEEAISALVFERAKRLHFFGNLDHVDYDLLKTVQSLVSGYEVEQAPMWQWEAAILDGYRIFRELIRNRGGLVRVDLQGRQMSYATFAVASHVAV